MSSERDSLTRHIPQISVPEDSDDEPEPCYVQFKNGEGLLAFYDRDMEEDFSKKTRISYNAYDDLSDLLVKVSADVDEINCAIENQGKSDNVEYYSRDALGPPSYYEELRDLEMLQERAQMKSIAMHHPIFHRPGGEDTEGFGKLNIQVKLFVFLYLACGGGNE